VTDAELATVLGAAVVRRRPWPYASSLPMEELELQMEGAGSLRLLFKDLTQSATLPRPAFLADPLREIAAYRDVLGPCGVDAPTCHAAIADEGRAWLFIELVDGEPLWQVGEIEVWEAAARWLAALHAAPPPAAPHLLRYDAEHLGRRFSLAASIPRAPEIGELVAERLARLPTSFIHGEFYAANVVIQRAAGRVRIRPVDWESAGVGPGVLDLAALTAGSWSETERSRIEDAYLEACPAGRRPDPRDLDHARLLLAAQWVGWSNDWAPPPEHARDWRAEATALIERLEL